MTVSHRAVNYFYGGDSSYASLLSQHRGAFEAGSPFPDYLYSCGSNHDDGEISHWAPFQWYYVQYLRAKYPRPWNASGATLASFGFGLVSHYVADISWHGLAEVASDYGLIQTLGFIDFNCTGLCDAAHTLADTGGEFVAAFATDLPWDDPSLWVIPVDDLVSIFHSANRTEVQPGDIEECAVIFFAGAEAIRALAALVTPLQVAASPTLGEVFVDLPVGGLDDMAVYTTRLFQRWGSWLDRGPPAIPPGHEYPFPPEEAPLARQAGQRLLKSFYRTVGPWLLHAGAVSVAHTEGGVTRITRETGGLENSAAGTRLLSALRSLLSGEAAPSPRPTALQQGWTAPLPDDSSPAAVASLLLLLVRAGGAGPVLAALQTGVLGGGEDDVRLCLAFLDAAEAVALRARSVGAAALQPAAPLSPAPVAIVAAESSLEYAGAALASGDYDGDGEHDAVITTYGHTARGAFLPPLAPDGAPSSSATANASFLLPQSGAFYARYGNLTLASQRRGSAAAATVAAPLSEAFPFLTEGPRAYERLGAAACTLDWNADGVDDLAVSAPTAGMDWGNDPWDLPPIFTYLGAVYIYLGARGAGLASAPAAVIFGPGNYSHVGTTLLCSDVDGDGHADLLVGSPYAYTSTTEAGRADVFLSGAGWAPAQNASSRRIPLAAANYSWAGQSGLGEWMGYSMAVGLGAAPAAGAEEAIWALDVGARCGGAAMRSGTRGGERAGAAAAAPSAALLIIGAPGYRTRLPGNGGPASVGRVSAFAIPHHASRASGVARCLQGASGAPLSPSPLFTISADLSLLKAPTSSSKLGHGVAIGRPGGASSPAWVLALGMSALDFCNTSTTLPGWDNIFNASFNTSAGSVTLLTVSPATQPLLRGDLLWSDVTGPALAPQLATTVLASSLADARFGWRVKFLDANGDGLDDLAVGAPMFSDASAVDTGREVGALVLYRGNASQSSFPFPGAPVGRGSGGGLPLTCGAVDAAWVRLTGPREFGRFGTEFIMGDVIGEGAAPQLLVAAPRANEPVPPQGKRERDGSALGGRGSSAGATTPEMPGAVYAFGLQG